MSEHGEIYTAGNKFYTAAGTDGMDKFHIWSIKFDQNATQLTYPSGETGRLLKIFLGPSFWPDLLFL